jgi:hypothetical protein
MLIFDREVTKRHTKKPSANPKKGAEGETLKLG